MTPEPPAASERNDEWQWMTREAVETTLTAALIVDCDGCGQVVVIPVKGDVGCGCAGTRWSLTRSRTTPEPASVEAAIERIRPWIGSGAGSAGTIKAIRKELQAIATAARQEALAMCHCGAVERAQGAEKAQTGA